MFINRYVGSTTRNISKTFNWTYQYYVVQIACRVDVANPISFGYHAIDLIGMF